MDIAELQRRFENLIKDGEIAEVDPAAGCVRVKIGELVTDWLRYWVPAAGGVSVHRPPSVGENCTVLSPSGETANGKVLCGFSGSQYPSPGNDASNTIVKFPDGAVCQYNHDSGAMTITGIKTGLVQAATSLTFDTPQATFTGAVTTQGLLTYQSGMTGSGGSGSTATINGSIKVTGGDVVADGISLKTHTHTGVTPGGGNTGAPQ